MSELVRTLIKKSNFFVPYDIDNDDNIDDDVNDNDDDGSLGVPDLTGFFFLKASLIESIDILVQILRPFWLTELILCLAQLTPSLFYLNLSGLVNTEESQTSDISMCFAFCLACLNSFVTDNIRQEGYICSSFLFIFF